MTRAKLIILHFEYKYSFIHNAKNTNYSRSIIKIGDKYINAIKQWLVNS